MTAPLSGPFIQAKGYTRGRSFRQASSVKWLGVHTAEGARTAAALGNFFRGSAGGSSHSGIGQGGDYAQYVNFGDTAWTNPPLNEESDTVELCGFARWTREEWLSHPAMLDALAAWLSWRAAVRGIPLVLLSAADLRAGRSGIVMHRTVNDVYKSSSHWDPGYNLPWDVVMSKAQGGGGVAIQPNPVPVTTDWAAFYNAGYTAAWYKSVQEKLNRLGYGLDTDGIRGPKTQEAVKDFQRKNGLDPDGHAGKNTVAKIDAALGGKPAAAPKYNIPALQQSVGAVPDGIWGGDTDKRFDTLRSATTYHGYTFPYGKAFAQSVVGTHADGVWGKNSKAAHDKRVQAIQRLLGVHVDGIWGKDTEAAYMAARKQAGRV